MNKKTNTVNFDGILGDHEFTKTFQEKVFFNGLSEEDTNSFYAAKDRIWSNDKYEWALKDAVESDEMLCNALERARE